MDYENAKAEREYRQNPPTGAPGQGDDSGWDDIFESEATGSSSAESPSDSLYGGNDINNTLNPSTNVQQAQQQQKSTEDYIFEGTKIAGKGLLEYIKVWRETFKNNTKSDWHDYGVSILKISSVGVILGFIFMIVEMFRTSENSPIDLVIGSIISMIAGVFFCMYFDKDASENNENIEKEGTNLDDESDDWKSILSSDEEPVYDDVEEGYSDGFEDEVSYEEDWDSFLGEDEGYLEEGSSNLESNEFNLEESLEGVKEIQQGTQTRQYLYETFMSVLPKVNPHFSDMNQITQDETAFFDFEDMLRSAAYQVGTKEEQIPELLSVFENDFLFRLNCSRPSGLKEQAIADEIANTYSKDELNRQVRYGVYATVDTSISNLTINLFKGFEKDISGKQKGGVTISLADVYSNIKDFILDTSIEIPLVWGISELGDAYYCDMKDNNSIIISGEPRGGKSWKGQSIVAQLAMFHSPKELEFYFFDGKDNASDYRYPASVLPHAKYFCGDMDRINEGLQKVINIAVDERGKKITESGCINIKDYNRTHPQDKIPYSYIVIDELQSLMNHFTETDQKDEAAKFRGYLSTIVSKLPYTGLRIILFPHRIVNDVISKNTYSLVSCRAVVRQTNMGELKNAVEVTEKTFPYKLAATGDMALKINEIAGGNVVYCHSEILTSTNESNRNLFDFIGGVWKKLEPDCNCIEFHGSIGGYLGRGTVASSSMPSKRNKQAPDNTQGEESYSYTGYNDSFDSGSALSDINDLDSLQDDISEDEDFWNSFT